MCSCVSLARLARTFIQIQTCQTATVTKQTARFWFILRRRIVLGLDGNPSSAPKTTLLTDARGGCLLCVCAWSELGARIVRNKEDESPSAMSAEEDDAEFLPPGFLPVPFCRNDGAAADHFSFIDDLEADLHADVAAGRAFLKQISPRSESSDDLVAKSSVLRSVLQDRSIRVSKENQSFLKNRKQQENVDVKRLRAEKEKLVTDLQKLEVDLSLEKNEKLTAMESLEREKRVFARCLEEEKIRSIRTVQCLQSELELDRKEFSKSIISLNQKIKDLEAQRQVLLEEVRNREETNDSAMTLKLQEIRLSLDEQHIAESQVLVNEMNTLRIAKVQAEMDAAKYKGMLDDKRADLSATIRSLQRRMGSFQQERDEFKQAYLDEHKKFEETYHQLLDCEQLRSNLYEATKSLDMQIVDYKCKIQQQQSHLVEQQTIIDGLRRHAISASVNDEGLQAEVDFLHDALDQEIQRNGLSILTLRSELSAALEALEQERIRNAELGEALEEEEFYVSELEEALEEVDGAAHELKHLRKQLTGYEKMCLEEETKKEHALKEHKTCLLELEDVKRRLQGSNDAKMKLNDSVMQLKAKVEAQRKRFREDKFENARIARDAVDTMNAFFKRSLDQQSAIIDSKQNQLNEFAIENVRLKNELRETREDLEHVLDIKKESNENVKELTMKIQELRSRHEAAILKSKQEYDLMEEDLLDALEREDESQQAHEAFVLFQKECLSESTKRLQEATDEVAALRAEVEIQKEKNNDSVYSVMDLTDLFRSWQKYFKIDPVDTHFPNCHGQSDATDPAAELEAIVSDASDLAEHHTSIDCHSISSELMVYGAASLSSAATTDVTELFRPIGSIIPSSRALQEFRDIVVTKSCAIKTSPGSDQSCETSLHPDEDFKPSPSTAFTATAAKPGVKVNLIESKDDKVQADDRSDVCVATSAESSLVSEHFAEKIEEHSSSKRAKTERPRSSIPPPPRTFRVQGEHKRGVKQLPECKGPRAIPSSLDSLKKQSLLSSGIPKPDSHLRNQKDVQQSALPRASDALRKSLSLSTTTSSGIGCSLALTTMLSSVSQQRTSKSSIPAPANICCSRLRSHLPSCGAKRTSLSGSLLQRQHGNRSNFSTPKKDDLSKKFDHLSNLSNMKLRSDISSSSGLAPSGVSTNRSLCSTERKQTSRPSIISLPLAPGSHMSARMPQATPLKFRDEIVEVLSPESPLLTPAKKRARLNVSPQILKIQTVWRRYHALQRYCNKRQAAIRIQALCRMHVKQGECRCLRSACTMIQSVYRMVIAKRQRSKIQSARRILVRWARSLLVSKRNRRDVYIQQSILEAAAIARQKYEQKQLSSALVVQAFLRMTAARLNHTRIRCATLVLQSFYRRRYQVFVVKATAIQLFWRSRILRSRFTKGKKAAISVQSLVRGARDRRCQKIRQGTAIVIQASWRKAAARNLRVNAIAACLKLQSVARCRYHRSVFYRSRVAAIWIQASWRGRRQLKQFLRLRNASDTIKTFICFHFTAKKHRQKIACSLSIIQANVRRHQARSKYTEAISACFLIQTFARNHANRQFQARLIQKGWRFHFLKSKVRKEKAASILQYHFRRYLEHETSRRRSSEASRIIQTAFRRHQELERSSNRREAACTLIQTMHRGHHARKETKQQIVRKQAATKIQAIIRMKRVLIRLTSLFTACMIIQRKYRDHLKLKVLKKAATTIQTIVRMKREQNRRAALGAAIISIQRKYRDHLISILNTRMVAATKLQGWMRSRAVSRHFNQVHASSVIVQAWFRSLICRRRFKILRLAAQMIAQNLKQWFCRYARRKVASAKVIQAHVRRCRTRKQYLSSKHGCIVIQSFWRRRNDEIAFRSVVRKVVLLQAFTRGNFERLLFRNRRKAATKIQSKFRMLQHNEAFIDLYASVLTIQSFCRMKAAKMLLQRHISARLIQTAIRVFTAKSKCSTTRARIVIVQSVVRRYAARCRFNRSRSASVSLQSVVRMRLTRVTYKRIREASHSAETPRLLSVQSLRRMVDNVSPGLRDTEICRTRRSKRLHSEMMALSPVNRLRDTLGDGKSDSRLVTDGEHSIQPGETKGSSNDVSDMRRTEIEKLKVTELRRKLQQIGVEGKVYNKLRKAQLVEMVLERT